jgi:hypothetical protein
LKEGANSMNSAVAKDLKESSKRFVNVVQPKLKDVLKGEFNIVEGVR